MLPQGLIQSAIGHNVQVELKGGDIITGVLEQTDTWMNLVIKGVTHHREGESIAIKRDMTYVRGNNIKFLTLENAVLEKAKVQQEREIAQRRKARELREQREARERADGGDGGHRSGFDGGRGGRGRGRGRGGRGGRGG